MELKLRLSRRRVALLAQVVGLVTAGGRASGMRGLVAMLSIGVVVLASAGVATAKNQPPNPPLTGETFTGSGFPNGSRDCANHTINLYVQGSATGPYVGSYTEQIRLTYLPAGTTPSTIVRDPYRIEVQAEHGPLVQLDALFTITALGAVVSGEKHLLVSAATDASCADVEAGFKDGIPAGTARTDFFTITAQPGALGYSATINTALGTSTDSGTTDMNASYWAFERPFSFTQNFTSTATAQCAKKKDCKEKH
jgi:hypothetical protein